MYDLILRDATIVSSKGRIVADVAIHDGKIAYVGPRPPRPAKEELSVMGRFLMPGVIDTAVQFDPNGDPGIWERESRAAVTGGITTVIGLPGGQRPVVDRASARHRADKVAGHSFTNFALWAAAQSDNAAELSAACNEGLVLGTLALLGTEDALALPAHALPAHLEGAGVLGLQLAGEPARKPGAETSCSPELQAFRDALRCVERAIHLVHLSTATELDLIDPVRGDFPVTAGVTPHHLFLSIEETEALNTLPPVRGEQDRRTLWTAVRRGRLDCVASDHHPSAADSGTPGLPGAELLFPLMLSAVKYGRLSLEQLVSLTSEAPARIFGLEGRGRVEKGAHADLILFSEGEMTRVDPATLSSGAGWSPYIDREAAPKPEMVLLAGQVVSRRGELTSRAAAGRLLSRA